MALSLKAQKREADKQSMQYRFQEAKKQELGLFRRKHRPWDPWTVTSTVAAEKWRDQVIKEITERITRIVDERLSEFQIRDKNDEINVLVREKDQWEIRIKELGGPDYKKVGTKSIDSQGLEAPGNKGYKYYGRAKTLPGVKELFQSKEVEVPMPRSRKEMYKNIDADYYGFRDEDNGKLLAEEAEFEAKEREEAARLVAEQLESKTIAERIEADPRIPAGATELVIPDYPDIPTQAQVEAMLVERTRKALLGKLEN